MDILPLFYVGESIVDLQINIKRRILGPFLSYYFFSYFAIFYGYFATFLCWLGIMRTINKEN